MIRAAKQPLFTWALGHYVHWKLRSNFRAMWCDGALPESDEPLLLYANHTSFWDGFAAHAFSEANHRDGYALMEEHNLARYPFLRRLGAFSIRRGEAKSARETLKYAAQLLAKPRAAVCVFPQGTLVPRAKGPLKLEGGVELLARMTGARCVPVAMHFGFFEHEYPDIVFHVGAAHAPEALSNMTARLEALVSAQAKLTTCTGLTPILNGRRSVAERWDAARRLT
ncbi:MAG: lysophospholipid acyltransferase family protein [Archangium sp.]